MLPRPSSRLVAATLSGLSAAALLASSAGAATPAEVQTAVQRGAAYLPTIQKPTGELPGFGGDWSLTSLAAAGVDASTVRTAPTAPSAQDFFLGVWTGGASSDDDWTSPSGQKPGAPAGTLRRPATDYERALLLAHAAGLQPTRLSADQNLVAQLAGLYQGRPATPESAFGRAEGTFGSVGLFNGTVFGLLALERTAVPQALLDRVVLAVRSNQHTDGGWTYQRVTSQASKDVGSDIDMTGAAVAALCEAGVPRTDDDVREGVAFLKSKLASNGSFNSAYTASGNTDSASWAVSGLNACGIDPQSADFTSAAGRTPVDFLISMQRTTGPNAGSFKYVTTEADGANPNVYSSQDAVRALAGETFSADPRTVRPAPTVPDGTLVPQALVVDAGVDGTGDRDVRFCRVVAPSGAGVGELLARAETASVPAGCVTGLQRDGSGRVTALNGVTPAAGQRWTVRRDGSAAETAAAQPVCHGQIVALAVAADPGPAPAAPACAPVTTPPPSGGDSGTPPAAGGGSSVPGGTAPAPAPVVPTTPARPTAPKVLVRGSGGAPLRPDTKGRVGVLVRCPRTAGKAGCRTVVTLTSKIRLTPRGEARTRTVGRGTVRVAAGRSVTTRIRLSTAMRRDLRRAGLRRLRIVAVTTAVGGGRSQTAVRTSVRPKRR
jgi:hypothetical protein